MNLLIQQPNRHRFFIFSTRTAAAFLLALSFTSAPVMAAPPLAYVKALDLSRPPSDDDLRAAGQLGGLLTPTIPASAKHIGKSLANDKTSQVDDISKEYNLKFGQAIQLWNQHDYTEANELFKEYSSKYPESPWSAEASLHTGCEATFTGKYADAEIIFQQLLEQYQDNTDDGGKQMANKARSRLAILKIAQNDIGTAISHFGALKKEGSTWRDRTYAASWLQRLAAWNADQLAMLTCGTQALSHILKQDNRKDAAREVLELRPDSTRGFSFDDLREIANGYGYPVTGLSLTIDELPTIPLPAIVQLHTADEQSKGHYWVMKKVTPAGLLSFYDPQSRRTFQLKPEVFHKQWKGNVIVFTEEKNLPGSILPLAEMSEASGGCCGVNAPPSDLGNPSDGGENQSNPPPEGPGNSCGAPMWSVNMINMNLYLIDTPLWYKPAIGPNVEISLSYNSQSSLANHEPFGNKWQFNYSSYLVVDPGGVVTIFLPDGRQDTYMPDGSGGYFQPYKSENLLTKIAENHFELKLPDYNVLEYRIPAGTTSMQPFLTSITDRHNLSLTMDYNVDNRLATITDATSKVTTISYNAEGLVSSVTDPFSRSADFSYDADRNLTSITDMGGYTTNFEYDEDVYLNAVKNSESRWDIYTEPSSDLVNDDDPYPPPGAAMWGNYRITVTDPMGQKKEYHFDGLNYYSKYTSAKNYVEYVDASTNNFNAPGTNYYFTTISGQGEIRAAAKPGGASTFFRYDYDGNRISEKDADGIGSVFTYNTQGMVTSETLPMGNTSSRTYGTSGFDLTSVSDGLTSKAFTYDAVTHDLTSSTNRAGGITQFVYNISGQPTSITDPAGVVTGFSYNGDHQLQTATKGGQQIKAYTYDTIGRILTSSDVNGLLLTYAYNDLNNVTSITYPDDSLISYSYADCCPNILLSVTDRSGRITSHEYDKSGQRIQTATPENGTIRYEYDPNDNLVKLLDSNNNPTTFTYNLDNLLTRKTYADGNSEQFSYTAEGQLATKTNDRGDLSSYSYNDNGMRTQVDYSDDTPDENYSYDAYDRLTSITDGVGSWVYGYDAASRLASIDGPWASDTISYQYDNANRLTQLDIESGNSVTYSYDTLGRMNLLQAQSGDFAYAYQGASSLVSTLSRPNTITTTYLNNTLTQLTSLSNEHQTNGVVSQHTYNYNLTGLKTDETSSGVLDPVFTPTQSSNQYNQLNQLSLLQYDLDGNLLQGITPDGYPVTADYDARNRLTAIDYIDGDSVPQRIEYLYSANDQLARVRRYANAVLAGESRFVRSKFLTIHERDGSNSVLREYTWQPGSPGGIGGLLNLNQGGSDYSYLYDGKGNITTVTDSSGATAAAYGYDSFGIPMSVSGTLDQPFMFSTKAYDTQTGLSYYGYRFYVPQLGRWLNRDPLGEKGGINLYGFVKGNPINFVDFWGLTSLCDLRPGPINPDDYYTPPSDGNDNPAYYKDPGDGDYVVPITDNTGIFAGDPEYSKPVLPGEEYGPGYDHRPGDPNNPTEGVIGIQWGW